MSKRSKEKVQVKLELEGALKDFLENECALECRSLTAHIRYIVNRYYMERNSCSNEQMMITRHQIIQNNNHYEQSILETKQNELQVRNMNTNEPNVTTENDNAPQEDGYELEQDVLAGEDFGYIDSNVLDF